MKLPFITLSLITILLSSCSGIKVGGQKSAKNLFESFSVGDQGTQYFIKPLDFEKIEGKGDLVLDVLFRQKLEMKDSATVNFTIEDLEIVKNVEWIQFVNASDTIKSTTVNFMFNEKPKKGFTSRFTTKIPLVATAKLFKNNDWNATLHFNDAERVYVPTRRSKKKIEAINNKLFILF